VSARQPSAVVDPSQGRILVVDDEDALLRAIGRKLTSLGYDVLLAANGKAAVDFLSEFTFEAILSDIDMPKMNGIELLQTVRTRDLDVPVVLMTGNPDVKTAVQAVELGAIQYLIKPFDLTEVGKVISRAVRLNRMARLKREALALVSEGGFGESDRLALETSFDRVLDTLWMAYQPIVRTADRTLFGYEALLRSNEKALPHPGAILDAAERLDRLPDLGRMIRKAACLPIPDAAPTAAFFVNLHSRDLMDGTLLAPTSPLSFFAERVVLEITERASLDGVTDVRAKIAELRRMGFRIAIDDLGAGYAGLTSFATLEPDIVKLDMSLVRDIDSNRQKERVVRSITALCKELNILVVAEGVETVAERDVLVAIGCDLLQGYLLAKPAKPFPEFAW
jgi:EAL domain-containing protein (putative c-di-GMP-specific phosphodiesterase class I)